jgi:Tol biopolymer transport system component
MARRLAASVLLALVFAPAACGGGGHESNTSPSYRLGNPSGQNDLPPGSAGVAAGGASVRTTSLLSSASGSFPNGPSRNAAISHDQRIARYIAYESDASNIVSGDSNGQTDIFLVRRAQPYGQDGTPWKARDTQLISRGYDGGPANGPSYKPAVDGDSHHAPHCVAFVSAASNLVPGDTNNKPDGFVYDTRTNTITRVTVDSAGRESNGSTYDISISGHCYRVAFTSDATNLALTQTDNPSWASTRTKAADTGDRQVYVHFIGGTRHNYVFKNLTFLASAAADGTPGNGDSTQPSIARSGKAVVFTSTATNLVPNDRTTTPDVYRRTITRKYQRGEGAGGDGVQTLQGDLTLVSVNGLNAAGNGPSSHPTITDDTRYVSFETDASDILSGDTNGVSDIARADLKSGAPKLSWVSWTPLGGIGNAPSGDPVISDGGEFVLFDSDASNLRPSKFVHADANGVKDVFLWNAPTRNVSLESRDPSNGYLTYPSDNPATSSRGNYVAFESDTPQGHEIYLRYLGPK